LKSLLDIKIQISDKKKGQKICNSYEKSERKQCYLNGTHISLGKTYPSETAEPTHESEAVKDSPECDVHIG
jgi:hypothetical protein